MKLLTKKGTTSKLVQLFIQDSSASTGVGLTGLAYNSASLTGYYYREGAASATAITLATMTVGTWASGGFKEVDATNMPGVYQLGLPDAAIATGANSVIVMLKGATNMAPAPLEIQLVDFDPNDTVRLGMTALPNAAAEAAGGLYTRGTGAGQINQPANGLVDVNTLRWNGTAVATPATAGIPDVNVKNMNNVAATSITTINANVGTTQPINFTGTGATAYVKSDMIDIAGAAVSTSSAQIGVNAVNIGGTAQTGRDIGASVLLSAGTGTGQLDFTSGVVKSNLSQILGTALTETAGQIAAAFKQFFNIASPTSTMNTITTVTTATNLTNAATAGDFTATMKTSLNAATPASVTGAVGSVTGNVGGNVVGSVGSVTAGVTVTTNNDKTGYALSSAGVQAIWDALTSALTTVGSIGKLIVTNLDAAISSRLATAGYTAPDNSTISTINTKIGTPVSSVSADIAGIQSDTDNIQTRLPAALVSGRMDSSVGAMAANTLTASALATDAVNEIVDQVWDELTADHVGAGSTGLALGSASAPSAAAVADAVWDEAISGHLTAGSTGNALNAAGSAGDPWSTPIPGAYGAGTAGKILGDNVNATISSRSTYSGTDTSGTTTLLSRLTSGRAGNLDNLDAAVSTRLASASYTAPDNATITAIAGYVDTEVAAIKAKTDNLPAAPAATGDIPTATQVADAILKRDMSAVTGESSRSLLNALRMLRNKWTVSGGVLTVYKEDDATTAWTGSVSSDAAADPITGNDPS